MISRDRISTTKNNFEGIIKTLIQGEKKSEITMSCGEGLELVSTLPNDELDKLPLKKGERARAHFEASSVIIGIAA
jgi:molybdopterin-binding protein